MRYRANLIFFVSSFAPLHEKYFADQYRTTPRSFSWVPCGIKRSGTPNRSSCTPVICSSARSSTTALPNPPFRTRSSTVITYETASAVCNNRSRSSGFRKRAFRSQARRRSLLLADNGNKSVRDAARRSSETTEMISSRISSASREISSTRSSRKSLGEWMLSSNCPISPLLIGSCSHVSGDLSQRFRRRAVGLNFFQAVFVKSSNTVSSSRAPGDR
jgi:hypothetical protein